MWSRHATASGKRLRTTTPTPLPQTVPSACASKGRQHPLAEKTSPSRCQYPAVCGTRMVTPPASAAIDRDGSPVATGAIARRLQCFPGAFQKKAVLRVGDFRVPRRETEECSVEESDVF